MQEKNAKILEKPKMKGVIETIFFNYMQEQKKNKLKSYRMLNEFAQKGQILFVGSSLMEYFPINEMQQVSGIDHIIYNRGVAGFTTEELLTSMEECIFELEPAKIFINIGSNDIGSPDYRKERLIENYDEILKRIHGRLPECKVYVMAFYPVNSKADFPGIDNAHKRIMFRTRTNPSIIEANGAVEELTLRHGYEFINVNEGLLDLDGNLKEEYTVEGLHLWPNAYSVILRNMKRYLL